MNTQSGKCLGANLSRCDATWPCDMNAGVRKQSLCQCQYIVLRFSNIFQYKNIEY